MDVPKKILVDYLEHRKKDLKCCLEWVKANKFYEIEKVGHQLKGNGTTFGFPDLSSLGADLELGAKNRDAFKIEKLLEKLSVWLTGHQNF